jgi:hypothetical protein
LSVLTYPLDKWLYAIYLLVTAQKGISSLQLSKEIGVTQKTAWFMLARLRKACGNGNGSLLLGIIEADETFLGGKEANTSRKSATQVVGRLARLQCSVCANEMASSSSMVLKGLL